jgi:hypothetical protein
MPLKPGREQAWRDCAGRRVKYDAVLLGLRGLVLPPYAPWSSDRALAIGELSLVASGPKNKNRLGSCVPESKQILHNSILT